MLIAALCVGVASPAFAQATRAEEARAAREAKAKKLTLQPRSRVERWLFAIEDRLLFERVLNPPRGFHLRLGGIAEGSGFGLGPGYRYVSDAFDARVSAAGSLKRYAIAEGAIRVPGTRNDSLYTRRTTPFVEGYVRRRDFPQEDFFGLGPDSGPNQRTNFALRDTLGRVTGGMQWRYATASVGAGYLDPNIGTGTDRRMPSTEVAFSPLDVPGLLQQPTFTFVQPSFEWTTLDRALDDPAGGIYRATVARYHDRDLGQFSFTRWDIDARQYVPLARGGSRLIALRAWAADADADRGQQVPFYLQPTLGGATTLRGFRTYRFRDRSALLLQAEYRWRINELVTGALFYDTGAVAPRLRDLDEFERDYGISLRAGSRTGIVFRADLALGGREGTRFLLRFDDVF